MAKKEILKPFIRSWEGGYVNDPYDRGGATKWGVTQATYQAVFGKGKKVINMTESEWDTIFAKYYWDKWKADQIENQSVANLLVDWYWGSGKYGIKIPQYALGLVQDGIVGPKTLKAINEYKYGQEALYSMLWRQREAFYRRIAIGTQKRYLEGWLNRLAGHKFGKLICNGGKIVDC